PHVSLHSPLSASPAHRVLHSFPTRRSSDLTAGARYIFPRAVATSNQPSSALRICSTVSVTISAPNFLACSAIFCASSHPLMLSRSEEHTSELQSLRHLVCRLLLEKKKNNIY